MKINNQVVIPILLFLLGFFSGRFSENQASKNRVVEEVQSSNTKTLVSVRRMHAEIMNKLDTVSGFHGVLRIYNGSEYPHSYSFSSDLFSIMEFRDVIFGRTRYYVHPERIRDNTHDWLLSPTLKLIKPCDIHVFTHESLEEFN